MAIDSRRLVLWRDPPSQTEGLFGTLSIAELRMDGKAVIRNLKTLEKSWHDNQRGVSCIPLGDYPLRKRRVGRFYKNYHKKFGHDYVVEIVCPPRTAVLLHIANWERQLKGCVAVGKRCKAECGTEKMLLASTDGYKEFHGLIDALFNKHGPDGLTLSIREKGVRSDSADIVVQ